MRNKGFALVALCGTVGVDVVNVGEVSQESTHQIERKQSDLVY